MNFNVIQGGRGTGRTTALMDAIHEFILAGNGPSEVLVIFPAHNWTHWWTREWQRRFPATPRPLVATVGNALNARGRKVKMIAVEDVDNLEEGIHDERFRDFWPCLGPDNEVLFTSAHIQINQVTHTGRVSKDDVLRRTWRKMIGEPMTEDEVMLAYMAAYIVTHQAEDSVSTTL